MLENAWPVLSGALTVELGLSKGKALRIFQLVAFALAHGLMEAAGGRPLELRMPDTLVELKELGPAKFARRYWPRAADGSNPKR